MTETPEDRPEPAPGSSASLPAESQPDGYYRLGAAAAWVGIVAGVVFIIAVIFFSGFFLGIHARGYHGHHRHDGDPGGMMGPGQWQRPGGPGGMMGPGQQQGPGGPGGMMGPGTQQGPVVTLTVVPIPGRT